MIWRRAAVAILVVLVPSSVLAQLADYARLQRQLEQARRDTRFQVDTSAPVDQRSLFQYGGYFEFDYLSLDGSDGNTHVLRQPQIVGYSHLNIDGVHDFFFRARAGYQDFGPGDSFNGKGDDWIDPTVERAVYRFDSQRRAAVDDGLATDNDFTFSGGRDLIYWANGLVLNQVIDGAEVVLSDKRWAFTFLAGQTDPDTVDFDPTRPHFDNDTRRAVVATMLSANVQQHRPYVYALWQRDNNSDDPSIISSPDPSGGYKTISTNFEYNSYYLGIGSEGPIGDRMRYSIEGAYEGGHGLSNSFVYMPLTTPTGFVNTPVGVPQTEEQIQALAGDLRLDYLFPDWRQTRLSAELILASGDTDRGNTSGTFNGNKTGTRDNAFNSLGLLNTGLAFNPPVSNLAMVRVGGTIFPAPDISALRRLQAGADLFIFCKMEADAPIDEPTIDRQYLGIEPDVSLIWRLTSDVTLAVRYGVFFPGAAIENNNDPRQAIFAGMTIAF